jgi:hypothetical protein
LASPVPIWLPGDSLAIPGRNAWNAWTANLAPLLSRAEID